MIDRLARATVDATAPAQRLAAFRVMLGVFVLGYLAVRLPVFWALGGRNETAFDGVGIFTAFGRPPGQNAVAALVIVAVVSGVAFTVGWRYRPSAVLFAASVLLLTTLRSSWGQLLHFENLMTLHLIVLAAAPAADVWSFDARSARGSDTVDAESVRYGWPLALAALITAVTYVIAGVAKLRYGGLDWLSGDTLRHHVAYSANRLDLIGGTPPVLAEAAVRFTPVLGAAAVLSVVLELTAPLALLGPHMRNTWVGAAWLMHVGILLTMAVGFPSPLFGVAFAPLYALERPVAWWSARPGAVRDSAPA